MNGYAGKTYLSPGTTERILQRVGRGDELLTKSPVEVLSDRELEVLRLIGLGQTTACIAKSLHLSIKTVETYRIRIRHKLHLENGTELTQFAAQWILKNE